MHALRAICHKCLFNGHCKASYEQKFIIIYGGEYPTFIYPCRRSYDAILLSFLVYNLMMSLVGQDIDLMRTLATELTRVLSASFQASSIPLWV